MCSVNLNAVKCSCTLFITITDKYPAGSKTIQGDISLNKPGNCFIFWFHFRLRVSLTLMNKIIKVCGLLQIVACQTKSKTHFRLFKTF